MFSEYIEWCIYFKKDAHTRKKPNPESLEKGKKESEACKVKGRDA